MKNILRAANVSPSLAVWIFISLKRISLFQCDQRKIKENGVYDTPDLAVEVLPPSTAKRDRGYKKDAYAKCGVREYRLVSPTEKSVEVYLQNGGSLDLHEVYSIFPKALWGK